ncbi:MAG: AMP-binding protein [Acidobacteria bacterium]|nr:AMP-binding protein [Acidobacteriota bacterium]
MSYPTVLHTYLDSVESEPTRLALRTVERSGETVESSYAELFHLARRVVKGLKELGIKPGDRLVIGLPTCHELLALYLGALFYRVILLIEPVPRVSREKELTYARLDSLMTQIGARYLVVREDTGAIRESHLANRTLTIEQILNYGTAEELTPTADGADIAHLQLTSGSTGKRKVAIVRHRNIVANINGIGKAIKLQPDDGLVFWLPLFHDMGLIAVSCSIYWQRPMTVTDPSNFVRNPIRFWLQLMSQYRGSITAAPNSAYEACTRLAALRNFEGLDLSSCRAAFWGAELIHRETVERFENAFGPYGYRREATLPVYGMAEATLAVTVSEVANPPTVDRIDASLIENGFRQANGKSSGGRLMDVVCVGRPLINHQVRIVDIQKRPLAEGQVGEIEVAGPSVVDGYWDERNEVAPLPSTDAYLTTGDLGYIRDGELYVIGRKKEIIIVKGQNFIPDEIESCTEKIVGNNIQKGVAAVGVENPTTKTESVHILIESRILPVPDNLSLEERIRDALAETLGLNGVTIYWLAKGKIPKTTSGKIQRFRCRELIRMGVSAPS